MTNQPPSIPRRGRKAAFDKAEVLDQLVFLFWRKGYDETTHDDMKEATGLSGSSLYNTFGDKQAIFDEVLDRYIEMSAALIVPLQEGGIESLIGWIDFIGKAIEAGQAPPGCLVVHSMGQHVGIEPAVQSQTDRYFCRIRDSLTEAMDRAVEEGQMSADRVAPRVALLESAYIGIMTAARAHSTPAPALAMVAGLRETIDAWAAQ